MVVLNDIELITCLRLLNLFGIGEFYFSNIYMTKHYLTVVERQSLIELSGQEKIVLFESGEGFYNFFGESKNEKSPIGLPGMSSIYYAKENKLPLVTRCKLTKKIADKNGVLVCNYDEALKLLNTQQVQIDYINKILNMMENNQNLS